MRWQTEALTYRLITTFESWVTRADWYEYAAGHPQFVPHPLVDRSQCTDPFLDQLRPIESARPLLTGICRRRVNYPPDGSIIYVTRVDRRVLSRLEREAPSSRGSVYFFVAALSTYQIHTSHSAAAATFAPNLYGPASSQTAFPPNLAHASYPGGYPLESCITHDVSVTPAAAHTPDSATAYMHKRHYNQYRLRARGLPVAECRFIEGLRFLDLRTAPLLSPAAWGGTPMGRPGLRLEAGAFKSRDGHCACVSSLAHAGCCPTGCCSRRSPTVAVRAPSGARC